MINIHKLESELRESADLLITGSKRTSKQYCIRKTKLHYIKKRR